MPVSKQNSFDGVHFQIQSWLIINLVYSLSTAIPCKYSLLANAPPDKAVCWNEMPQRTMMSWLYKPLCILAAIKKHLKFIRVQVPFAACFDVDGGWKKK